jgi:hypothetical protein
LSPRFVEALMGWPIDWTACAFLETVLSQSKPQRRSSSCIVPCDLPWL